MTPIRLYATFTARTDCGEQLASLVSDLTRRVREEPGNEFFEPSVARDDPRSYFVYEQYASPAAFENHIRAHYVAEFNQRVSPLIEEHATRLTWLEPLAVE